MLEHNTPAQSVPLRLWAARPDAESLRSLERLARWDRFAGPIAVLPDVHSAGDVCVGTVFATRDCVLPAAVGEDLGCGMLAQGFEREAARLDRSALERIVARTLARVPVGSRTHRHGTPLPAALADAKLSTQSLEHSKGWLGERHMGTLGGGNHFIELQRDTLGRLWLTVHSGSRGIGAAIATHHARAARTHTGPHRLGCLELESQAAAAFWNDLAWALAFAAENRRVMAERVLEVLAQELELSREDLRPFEAFDVAHNLIRREVQPGGETRVIHRKGAMPALPGSRGILPGSMGTASYIIEGRGNPASFASCSHGAGRKLSRGEARRRIPPREVQRQMRHVVLPADCDWHALAEEAPGAYKDIRTVLEEQADLATPVLRLEPLAVIKG